jgi:hypothetical protein
VFLVGVTSTAVNLEYPLLIRAGAVQAWRRQSAVASVYDCGRNCVVKLRKERDCLVVGGFIGKGVCVTMRD